VIPERDFIYTIGENTLHIACNHNFVLFMMNIGVVLIKNMEWSMMVTPRFRYAVDKYWLIYTAAAIVLPVLGVLLARELRQRVWLPYILPRLRPAGPPGNPSLT
jgi:fucose 4-O-acetylase-like acetyltransferase